MNFDALTVLQAILDYLPEIIIGAAISILVSRLSKSPDERNQIIVSTAEGLAKIADMTADQLIEKIKQIDELTRNVELLRDEIRVKNRELREERAHNALLIRQLIEEAHLIPVPRPVFPDTDPPRSKST